MILESDQQPLNEGGRKRKVSVLKSRISKYLFIGNSKKLHLESFQKEVGRSPAIALRTPAFLSTEEIINILREDLRK